LRTIDAEESLLNCIDKDGTNSGFGIELVKPFYGGDSISFIALSGA